MMVGERLKAIREHRKMSQGDIERKTGLLRCYVSRVENGHTVPAIETLEKWARALDIRMAQLFLNDGERMPKEVLPQSKKRTNEVGRADRNELRKISETIAKVKRRDRAILLMLARKMAMR